VALPRKRGGDEFPIDDDRERPRAGGMRQSIAECEDRGMREVEADDQTFILRLSRDEVIVLHETLSRAEWAHDLEVVTLDSEAERSLAAALMLALRPAVPHLGTDEYAPTVRAAEARLTAGPSSE